jgi:dihydrolipoamide dehydrogenase
MQQGFLAATNAVLEPTIAHEESANTTSGFTDPEYASVGLTEAKARESHDVLVSTIPFDSSG